jgi:hypothetical protein
MMDLVAPFIPLVVGAATVARFRPSSRVMLARGGWSAFLYRTYFVWFFFVLVGMAMAWNLNGYPALQGSHACLEFSMSATDPWCRVPLTETIAGVGLLGIPGFLGVSWFLWRHTREASLST